MTTPQDATEARDPWYPGGQRDASLWVEEYLRLYPEGCADGDTMLGWFANAIETGVMFGERVVMPREEALRAVLEKALIMLPFTDRQQYRDMWDAAPRASVTPPLLAPCPECPALFDVTDSTEATVEHALLHQRASVTPSPSTPVSRRALLATPEPSVSAEAAWKERHGYGDSTATRHRSDTRGRCLACDERARASVTPSPSTPASRRPTMTDPTTPTTEAGRALLATPEPSVSAEAAWKALYADLQQSLAVRLTAERHRPLIEAQARADERRRLAGLVAALRVWYESGGDIVTVDRAAILALLSDTEPAP